MRFLVRLWLITGVLSTAMDSLYYIYPYIYWSIARLMLWKLKHLFWSCIWSESMQPYVVSAICCSQYHFQGPPLIIKLCWWWIMAALMLNMIVDEVYCLILLTGLVKSMAMQAVVHILNVWLSFLLLLADKEIAVLYDHIFLNTGSCSLCISELFE